MRKGGGGEGWNTLLEYGVGISVISRGGVIPRYLATLGVQMRCRRLLDNYDDTRCA